MSMMSYILTWMGYKLHLDLFTLLCVSHNVINLREHFLTEALKLCSAARLSPLSPAIRDPPISYLTICIFNCTSENGQDQMT